MLVLGEVARSTASPAPAFGNLAVSARMSALSLPIPFATAHLYGFLFGISDQSDGRGEWDWGLCLTFSLLCLLLCSALGTVLLATGGSILESGEARAGLAPDRKASSRRTGCSMLRHSNDPNLVLLKSGRMTTKTGVSD